MRTYGRRSEVAFAGVLVAMALLAGSAAAHPLAPALLSLEELSSGEFAVIWRVSLLRPTGSDVRPVLPRHCRVLEPARFVRGASDLTESWKVDCGPRGLVGSTLAVRGLERSRTDALLRVKLADGRSVRGLVRPGASEFVVPERESVLDVVRAYLRLGVEHLLFGLDHVLFVIGLVLLVRGWRMLVATITSFTVGHSVTLSLATLGVVDVPTRFFEFAIAFSILLLGAELARREAVESSPMRRWPWAVGFGFGLLHGLGFAGALSEIGLPQGEIPLALFAFNVGVEFGQLGVVIPLVAVGWLARDWLAALPARAVRLPAYAIGSLAGYWCIERALVFF